MSQRLKKFLQRAKTGSAWAAALLGVAACVWPAQEAAAATLAMTPSGQVSELRQLRLVFSEAVVPAGDPRLPAPGELRCAGQAKPVAGDGRWASEREWLFDLREPLAAMSRCSFKLSEGFKPLAGVTLSGAREFSLSTGPALVVRAHPWEGSQIEEDQHFLLQFNGVVSDADLAQRAWCEVEGLGERQPVKRVTGKVLEAVLKSEGIAGPQAARAVLLSCQRPLPPDAHVQIKWRHAEQEGKSANKAEAGVQRFEFQVRRPFTAEFSCERERANAPCLPIRPLRVVFSEAVPRELAQQIKLQPKSGSPIAPSLDKDNKESELSEVSFQGPFAENAEFSIVLPKGLKDRSGRLLSNADSFPALKVQTGIAPPLAKFAAAPFGILEREAKGPAVLPITMRHVQSDWAAGPNKASPGEIRIKRVQSDAEVLAWYAKLKRYHENQLTARELGLPASEWDEIVPGQDGRGNPVERKVPRYVRTREASLLQREAGTETLALPAPVGGKEGDARPFEVIGLPLAQPGYHVVELSSRRLGQALLDKAAPMYVRTGVLVTNLGVHFKLGRENSLVWVTSLDKGKPVADADVAVNDCHGKRLWAGRTDAQGLARINEGLERRRHGNERCEAEYGLFVTARKADAQGQTDMAFVFSNWNKGIESWRFNQSTSNQREPDVRAHTVLDRSLLRAGETVSMKHFFRLENSQGLALAGAAQLPDQVTLTHDGSGQQIVLPLSWPSPRSSVTQWQIPANAKLGTYSITLERGAAASSKRGRQAWHSGSFRVEEFRLPLIDARLSGPKALPIAPSELRINAQLNYLSGGGVAAAPLKLSAVLRPRYVQFAGYEEFNFSPPASDDGTVSRPANEAMEEDESEASRPRDSKLVADKLATLTDRNGAAELLLKNLPKISQPSELQAQITFADPNGETKTASQSFNLWPAKLVLGLKAGSWGSNRGKIKFSALALDTAGKPLAGQRLEVRARLNQTISSRKRMVGGFYAYDNHVERKDLGALCSGSSDEHGLLSCESELDASGEVELIVQAKDADGRSVQAATTAWLTRQGELWFAQDNDDRIDVLPEKKHYEPGETARLQVRMPYREATALVAIEREGVIETRLVTLRGDDPTIELKIDKAWAPNVYVSVLALRGRIHEVPWYSFFSWGWKAPINWWQAWRESRNTPPPTALVDLAKPSFKLGVANLQVGLAEHQLQVMVSTDKPQYSIRQKVQTRIKVLQNGQPLKDAEVAFAAVDEGLLLLGPNNSWDLLAALIQQRSWGVETASAQSEIIGRRHYGRKAVAAGGGGGHAATRELFDTLLLWQAVVKLDANGEALVEVPLNDSLTSFRLVAVADAGAQKFGTGQTTVRVTQDLQVLSGLPPLAREGDRFQAMLTVRNSTTRAMKLRATLQGQVPGATEPLKLAPQDLNLAAGAAQELQWQVTVPEGAQRIDWELAAQEQGGGNAQDRVKLSQRIVSAVPLQVLQASLSQLDGKLSIAVAPPADALPLSGPKQGGVNISLLPRLGGELPGPRRFFETYPYSCLEQQTSKALGLHDEAQWQAVMAKLPGYLDAEGLAHYFPPRADSGATGSERLTAYLLAASQEAGREIPAASRQRMLDGLQAYVEGRLVRSFWTPKPGQLDGEVRRLNALEALSRYGRASPALLSTVDAKSLPTWPTAAVLDWLQIHQRLKTAPERDKRLAEAQNLLRSRLTYAGTTLKFSNEEGDAWWWLMDSADANAARLILALVDEPTWAQELPRLLMGTLARQRQGAWSTTTANLWGVLALDKFSARFEKTAVAGQTAASLGSQTQKFDWAAKPAGGQFLLPWPAAANGKLELSQEGAGKPWVTLQSLAAVPLKSPLYSGYRITRTLQAVEQKQAGKWSRGDVIKVRLELEAASDMTWVVLSDPLPTGAAVLGSGLGGQSSLAAEGESSKSTIWPSYEERAFEAWRGYFEYLPRGKHQIEYTIRLNNAGRFQLPGTRAEAMYAPDSFGVLPQQLMEVQP
ncbi:alpha-2-macroglobulin [Paucibacter sp. KBW04]|uniref:alpha-2-macroglobulin family protein n=1 Tax=Paucibacter sp. KBW04 TaxID=2153361 RepID=UPI000F572245|nr:MG2 domain-containing protein [Paucibacter sp. KBW04]RQO57348.1 alpha-2-macroglobulin [Paucibacter sp. KBW04]